MYSKFIQDAAIELCDIRGDFSHDPVETPDSLITTKMYKWESVAREIQNFLDIKQALAVATAKRFEQFNAGVEE